MSTLQAPEPQSDPSSATSTAGRWRRRGARSGRPAAAVIARGEPTIWLTAGALAFALFMIVGLITLVVAMGGSTFWPTRLMRVELNDGRVVLGEVTDTESYVLTRRRVELLGEADQPAAQRLLGDESSVTAERTLLRVDNKQLTGEAYVWVSDFERRPGGASYPDWATTVERTSWGRFLGFPDALVQQHVRPVSGVEEELDRLIAFFEENLATLDESQQSAVNAGLEQLREDRARASQMSSAALVASLREKKVGGDRVAVLDSGDEVPLADVGSDQTVASVRESWSGPEAAWHAFEATHAPVRARAAAIHDLDKHGLARLSDRIEQARMNAVRAGLAVGEPLAPLAQRLSELDAAVDDLNLAVERRVQVVAAVTRRFGADSEVTRAVQAAVTRLNSDADAQRTTAIDEAAALEKSIPASGERAVAEYRRVAAEARQEMLAITADMAAMQAENDRFVWRLLAADGTPQDVPVAEVVRAFTPNRLGFFARLRIYLSRWSEFLFAEPREANTEGGVFPAIWGTVAMTLIMTLAVVPFGVLAALFLREYAKAGAVVSAVRIAVNNLAGVPSIVFGVFGLGFFCYVVGAGIDGAFYPEYVSENKPVFGTGGLMWASLTLALLTLPVVIVATEEALAAVPNSLREGSYACGASKWQTIRRIVLPRALPGIMTGMILAMARGAGEVAPLMLVGAVKIAPELPVDAEAPFLHPSRSFMHLGFHIYDLGFQSPDSEAAKPMVFTTTLLLIAIVAVLNVAAIRLRSRLRKKFATSQF